MAAVPDHIYIYVQMVIGEGIGVSPFSGHGEFAFICVYVNAWKSV